MVEILSLIENVSSTPEFCAEHGLSLHIKQNNECYLLDTGASNQFILNAEKMGIDLRKLKAVIISHNHSDHVGGLSSLLQLNEEVKVYIKNAAKSEFYSRNGGVERYSGIGKGLFETYADRFVFFEEELRLSDSLCLLSNQVYDRDYFCKDMNLLEKKDNCLVNDEFKHELFMVLEEKDNLIIISSCSHNGIVNIVNTVKKRYPGKTISHIIGGFHLMSFGDKPLNCSEDYVKEVAQILKTSCADTIYTCHCTGQTAYNIMKDILGEQLDYVSTGSSIIIS